MKFRLVKMALIIVAILIAFAVTCNLLYISTILAGGVYLATGFVFWLIVYQLSLFSIFSLLPLKTKSEKRWKQKLIFWLNFILILLFWLPIILISLAMAKRK